MSTPPDTLAVDPRTIPLASPRPNQAAVSQQPHTRNDEEEEEEEGQQVKAVITTGCITATPTTSPRLLKSRSYPPMAPCSSKSSGQGRDMYFQFTSPFRHPSSPPSDSSPAALAHLLRTFDESLRTRLRSLLPVPETTTTLAYLSRAVEVLRSVHADAARVITDPSLQGAEDAAVSAYLDSSAALLDSCNAASARIDRLLRRRLFLAVALHHLLLSDDPDTERIRKARKAVAEWEQETDAAADEAAEQAPEWTSRTSGQRIKGITFPRDPPPSGKSSAIARAVYAVEAVSALVGGMLLGALFGTEPVPVGTVPTDFGWADAYNELRKAISSRSIKSYLPVKVSAVESRARKLARALEDADMAPPPALTDIRPIAEALEEEIERMTDGLETLSGAVNGLFRAAMGARNAAVEGLRLDRKNCK